jgi:hypothetical protein
MHHVQVQARTATGPSTSKSREEVDPNTVASNLDRELASRALMDNTLIAREDLKELFPSSSDSAYHSLNV